MTFEQYCRERWNWGRRRVNQQIAACRNGAESNVIGTTIPHADHGDPAAHAYGIWLWVNGFLR